MCRCQELQRQEIFLKKNKKALVDQQIQKPLLGLFGTEKVNVLQLNIELDKLK